jgi:hypothetical protein
MVSPESVADVLQAAIVSLNFFGIFFRIFSKIYSNDHYFHIKKNCKGSTYKKCLQMVCLRSGKQE